MKKTGLLLLALLTQLFVTLVLGTAVSYGYASDQAPSGLLVWGHDFSGLSKAELAKQLKEKIPNALIYQGREFPLKTDRAYAEIDHWLAEVFPPATDSRMSDALKNLSRSADAISLASLGLDKDETIAQLEEIGKQINRPMLGAAMTYQNGHLLRTEGKPGQELDLEATWTKISAEHERSQVEVETKEVPSQPNLADLAKITDALGDYTTYYNGQDLPRTTNLRLAAKALNNLLIPPGQVFSFNDTVGERTETAGYLPAIVFVDKIMTKENGGGICQDSSTLYQAVLQAHLAIEEKHTHSLPVYYVLKGQDATVSYGQLDFRFKNDTRGYILISARTGENWLRIRLFGIADDRHPVLQNPGGYPTSPLDWNKDPK